MTYKIVLMCFSFLTHAYAAEMTKEMQKDVGRCTYAMSGAMYNFLLKIHSPTYLSKFKVCADDKDVHLEGELTGGGMYENENMKNIDTLIRTLHDYQKRGAHVRADYHDPRGNHVDFIATHQTADNKGIATEFAVPKWVNSSAERTLAAQGWQQHQLRISECTTCSLENNKMNCITVGLASK